MHVIKTKYNDLFTGEEKPMIFKGEPLTPTERWFEEGDYRKAEENAEETCRTCKYHHHRWFADKCGKVGITGVSASNIKLDHVCNYYGEYAYQKKNKCK